MSNSPSAPHRGPRIGIEASSVAGPRTGIGHATAELMNHLMRRWPEDWPPLLAWVNSPRHEPPHRDAWMNTPHCVTRRTRWPGKLLLRGWQYAGHPKVEFFTGELDLIHSPASYIMPARAARRIITVHDLYFKYEPGHVEPFGGGYFAQTFGKGLPQVDHVIAISDFTRRELQHHYRLPGSMLTVIHQGVNMERFHATPNESDARELEALGIEKPYLLCVATIEPRKNLVTLIEGFARARHILQAARQKIPRLVIVGMQGWGIKAFEARLSEARLEEHVKVTGYLPDEAMPTLYRHALGFVFPSVYEGFGMPALEAMASGCPAMLAEAGALPEVGGDAAMYFNPRDSDALARSLARFLGDPNMRDELRQAGLKRAAEFSWDSTARGVLDVYRRMLRGNGGQDFRQPPQATN